MTDFDSTIVKTEEEIAGALDTANFTRYLLPDQSKYNFIITFTILFSNFRKDFLVLR